MTPVFVSGALLTLTAAVLCFVPLFNVLGYEANLALGLVVAVTSPILGVHAGRGTTNESLRTLRPQLRTLALATAQLLPALILLCLNALRVQNCNMGRGLAWFVALPLCNALYGVSLGFFAAVLADQPWLPAPMRRFVTEKRTGRAALAATLSLAPLLLCLWRLYAHPPIYVYDALWGYFAGSLYDEALSLDRSILLFRAGTGVRIVLLWLATTYVLHASSPAPKRQNSPGWLATHPASRLVMLLGCAWLSETIFMAHTHRTQHELAQALPVAVERPGLVIHLPADTPPQLQQQIADDHAFRLYQIRTRLELPTPVPEDTRPIHSYVYRNQAHKAQLMGGRRTNVAKPWLREIHVHDVKAPHPVVAHELVHAVAAELAPPPLHVPAKFWVWVNMGLVEGLAVALTPEAGPVDLPHSVRAMRAMNLAPNLRHLDSLNFWQEAPRRAYTTTGAFIRKLLRDHGAEPLKKVYGNGNFAQAYGRPLPALVQDWESSIDTLPLEQRSRNLIQERYRQTSMFQRPCAREIARLRSQARRLPKAEAPDAYRAVAQHLGNTPSVRLDLALSLRSAGDMDGFLKLGNTLLTENYLNASQVGRLRSAMGETLWARGHATQAREHFAQVAHLRLNLHSERLQWVRLWVLDRADVNSAETEQLRRYLSGQIGTDQAIAMFIALRRQHPTDPTIAYLLGRMHHAGKAWASTEATLAAAPPHPNEAIEAERWRLIAHSRYQQANFSGAQQAYLAYAKRVPISGEQARAKDWAARAAWAHARASKKQ